jgi:hypothetical protein
LGIGLFPATPSNAGAAAVTALTVAKDSGSSDTTLVLDAATGSALGLSYNVYTRGSTLAIGELAASITSAGDTTTGFRKLTIAAGDTTTLAAAAATSWVYTAALTSATATTLADAGGGNGGTSPFSTFTASTSGTKYLIWNDGIKASDGTASTGNVDQKYTTGEAYVQLTVYKSSAASSTITLGTAITTLAGRVGQQVSITPTGTTAANTTANGTTYPLARIAASITSQPRNWPVLGLSETNFSRISNRL